MNAASCEFDAFIRSRAAAFTAARLSRIEQGAPIARLSPGVLGVAIDERDPAIALRRAAKMQAAFDNPVSLGAHTIDVSLTGGVALAPLHASAAADLIERANIALDLARASRRSTALFNSTAYGDPAANLSLMSEMRAALKDGTICPHYQLKYDLKTDAFTSAEALVRWSHAKRGAISPDAFIPMAEETGHIRALTEWMVLRALQDQWVFAAQGHDIKIAVNISARLLSDGDFIAWALSTLQGRAAAISFEITETAVIDNPALALKSLDALTQAGVEISIDDYGAGLSSLSYLKQIRADELKIDKSFILAMGESQRDALLVRSTIDLAHALGLKVTAEGVETHAALGLLRAMGCDFAQGFLLARPMALAGALALLKHDSAQALAL